MSAAAVLAAAVVGGLLGGGATYVATGGAPVTSTSTVTATETETVTTTMGSDVDTEPPSPPETGLTQLNEAEDVQFSVAADFENRSIGGRVYQDAVTGLVYSDGSGFSELTIATKARFSSLQFVVGIDDEAECSQSQAIVSITDERGRRLWGPEPVAIGRPIAKTISISRPIQVNLNQSSGQSEGQGCDGGEAHVSWGNVVFSA